MCIRDRPSGVQSITMPDGTVVEGGTADFAADANGKYDFIITDNGGNTFTLRTEVSNIDHLAPEAEYTVTPDVWTNGPAAIHVTATDPEPEDGYAPSGVKSCLLYTSNETVRCLVIGVGFLFLQKNIEIEGVLL